MYGGGGTGVDGKLEAVADGTRRDILDVLAESGEEMSLEELQEALEEESYRERLEELRISLHHNHLPRLDEEGLIDYDEEEGTAEYSAGGFSRVLDAVEELEEP